jgi:hypothetical protein
MKSPFIRVGEILTLLAGIAAVAGFLILPFARNPITFRLENGLQLIQAYTKRIWIYPYSASATPQLNVGALIGLIGHWGIVLLSAIVIVLVMIQLFTQSGRTLPLITAFVSLAGVASLFLAFYDWTTTGGNLFIIMFQSSFLGPTLGIGWWICAGSLLLALVLCVLISTGSSSPRRSQYSV